MDQAKIDKAVEEWKKGLGITLSSSYYSTEEIIEIQHRCEAIALASFQSRPPEKRNFRQ